MSNATPPKQSEDYVALNVAAFERLLKEGAYKASDGRYIIMFQGKPVSQHPDHEVAYDVAIKECGEEFLIQDLLEESNITYLGYRDYAIV